jgi:hypothetical protein
MRTIKGQGFPQDGDDVKFPDGQIRNETVSESGTPVVRELYGDIVTNVYKILRDAGIEANELEDSETAGYQLLEALKKFANSLNDIRQILTVDDLDITAVFNFDSLPDNYVFIGQITEDILAGENYTIKGAGDDEFPLTSSVTILASSLVLVTLNEDGCSITQLNQVSTLADKYIAIPFGTPLSFNDSKNLLYYSDGVLFNDSPMSWLIENRIQTFAGTTDVKICDVIFHKKHLICLTKNIDTEAYQIYAFHQDDFNTVVGTPDILITNAGDNVPYMYCDGQFVYFSNSTDEVNDTEEDWFFAKFLFDPDNFELNYSGNFQIENGFVKTTNVFITDEKLFTFILGVLTRFEFGGLLANDNLGFFNTINGVVFKLNGSTYYSNGEIGAKWQY